MTEKLRSHLRNEKGFTLIELLVVIAIIAILVTIVLVAINPIARINEANQRDGQSRVRAVAGGVESCLTSELGKPSATTDSAAALCDTEAELTGAGQYLKTFPNDIFVGRGDNLGADDDKICIWTTVAAGGNFYAYKTQNAATFTGNQDPGSVYLYGVAVPADCDTVLED